MSEEWSAFFKTAIQIIAIGLIPMYELAAFCLVPPPLNYFVALIPLYIALILWRKEINRRAGIIPSEAFETTEDRQKRILDEIEREVKKTKPLP